MAIYYTPEELARVLKVSGETVRARLRKGEISGMRFGRVWRIPRDEAERVLGSVALDELDRELTSEEGAGRKAKGSTGTDEERDLQRAGVGEGENEGGLDGRRPTPTKGARTDAGEGEEVARGGVGNEGERGLAGNARRPNREDPPAKNVESLRVLLASHQEELQRRFGVRVVGVFGSYARSEAGPTSDVDLLIELERPIGWEIVDVKEHLETLLGLRVDIVTLGALRKKPSLRKSIEEDLVHVQT